MVCGGGAVDSVLQLYFLHLDRRVLVILHNHIDGGPVMGNRGAECRNSDGLAQRRIWVRVCGRVDVEKSRAARMGMRVAEAAREHCRRSMVQFGGEAKVASSRRRYAEQCFLCSLRCADRVNGWQCCVAALPKRDRNKCECANVKLVAGSDCANWLAQGRCSFQDEASPKAGVQTVWCWCLPAAVKLAVGNLVSAPHRRDSEILRAVLPIHQPLHL